MRCLSCNTILTEFESTRRYEESGSFVDLCNNCLSTIPIFPPTTIRADLIHNEDYLDELAEE